MIEFTASNGVKITPTNAGKTGYATPPDGYDPAGTDYLSFDALVAFREYFQAERDEQLGRVHDGDYAIYPHKDGQRIRIVSETDGRSWEYWRDSRSSPRNGPALIASVYFSNHPEPKPWADANDGDIWMLRGDDHPGEDRAYIAVDGRFFPVPPKKPAEPGWRPAAFASSFTTGERFWPEVSE